MDLTIHHHGTPHSFYLPASATLQGLSAEVEDILNIPPEAQKFLIAPKPGMQKAPFPPTLLSTLLPLDSPKFKITLLGTPAKAIADLHQQEASALKRQEARASALASARRANIKPAPTRSGGIHTLSDSSSNHTFHRLVPLPYLQNPSRSLRFLERLRDDPGIKAAMAKHKFSVPVLTEMDPIEHTTSESRTLGLNRNKGEVIELRLRTDAYDGYRDYRTIRKTLCHELAHCVYGDHDRDFWNLTAQIEREVDAGDWKSGGHRLTNQDFYDPGDWENAQLGGEAVDERGWTGGTFVLGRSNEAGPSESIARLDANGRRWEELQRQQRARARQREHGQNEKQDDP